MATAGDDGLLERHQALAQLEAELEQARLGAGRTVLVGGEAGVGKTSLARLFTERNSDGVRVVWGACEALFTPRPLGPIYDIVQSLGGWTHASPTTGEERTAYFGALLEELRSQTTIAVFEDVHWADEATLDALKYLGRRVETTRSLIVMTFRDDEVGAEHPLRRVLGELPSANTTRVLLSPLSPEAVGELARRAERPTRGLYEATGGNPFYVTEILAAEGGDIPLTVLDAVLARAARVSTPGRRLLEALAIVPGSVELSLAEELGGDSFAQLAECLASGMLVATGPGVGFRHELARLSIESTIAPDRRIELHEAAFEALSRAPDGARDLAALAHHADMAGNGAAVLRFAPAAARRASDVGAHTEAAEHYTRALRYSGSLPGEERAELLASYADEAFVTGALPEALDAHREAIALFRESGNRLAEGSNRARIVHAYIRAGLNEEAEESSMSAIAILEALPPSRELALAYGYQAYLRMLARDNDQGVEWGERSLALTEELADPETRAQALNLIGTSHLMAGRLDLGREYLLRSLELSAENGLQTHVAMAYSMLGSGLGEMYALEESEHWLREHIAYGEERDFDTSYCRGWLAATLAYRGRWDEATATAQHALGTPNVTSQITALITLGRVRARRGDPGVNDALDEAVELASVGGHLQRLGHVRAARAEAAWLAGDTGRTIEEARAVYDLALEKRHLWFAGELAYWQWKAGALDSAPDWIAEPYAKQLAGDTRGAAAAWSERGCVYEAARALAESDVEADIGEALAAFERLGARPAAHAARQSLRALGASVPRGPRAATRENPASLTAREIEVLALVAEGLSNSDIAGRLVVSRRTVDHHVSAILRKLGARSRGEAVVEAKRLALL